MDEEYPNVASEEEAAVAQALALAESSRLPQVVRALRNPNFRLFWSGNFLSNIGTWMQNVAQGWLVLVLTNSAFWLGVVGFAGSIPFLFFTLFGGVIADRVDKRRLLIVTQSVMMVLAFVLAGLAWFKVITVWEVAVIAFLNGTAMAMNAPSYQAMVPRLVKREDLTNAIALNSAQFNMSRIVGPTLGGYAMALLGVAGNFFLNGVSFLAVLWALTRIRYPDANARLHRKHVGQSSRGICLRAKRAADAGSGMDDDGGEFSGDSVYYFHPLLRKDSVACRRERTGLAAGLFGGGVCAGRRDGGSQGRVAASRQIGHVCRSHLFRGNRLLLLLAEFLGVGLSGIRRGFQRNAHVFFIQCVHSASVIGRDAGAHDEYLRNQLSGSSAVGCAAGRRSVAPYPHGPCIGDDGRIGSADLLRFLYVFAAFAGTGLTFLCERGNKPC